MGKAAFDEEAAFDAQPLLAAAVICRTPHGNLHVGLLHRTDGSASQALHLGWQDYLSNDWEWQRLWAAPNVPPERLRSIAGYCRLIWNRFQANGTFPYALKLAQASFSSDGQLQLPPGAKGLTCATFVLAVFNAAGIKLVDDTQWPVRAEEDRKLLETLRNFAKPEHFKLLEREVDEGCQRIHPQEVLGACEFSPPAGFQQSCSAGALIEARLPVVSQPVPTAPNAAPSNTS